MTKRFTYFLGVGLAVYMVLATMMLMAWHRAEGGNYRDYLKDKCEWCHQKGTFLNPLNVHHIEMQVDHPELRDVESNCITLHWRCQFVLGHFCNTKKENPKIREIIELVKDVPR